MIIMEINKFIDHTILKATATKEDVKKLFQQSYYENISKWWNWKWTEWIAENNSNKNVKNNKF